MGQGLFDSRYSVEAFNPERCGFSGKLLCKSLPGVLTNWNLEPAYHEQLEMRVPAVAKSCMDFTTLHPFGKLLPSVVQAPYLDSLGDEGQSGI